MAAQILSKTFLLIVLFFALFCESIFYLPLVFLFIFFISFFSKESLYFIIFLAFLAGIFKDAFFINKLPFFTLFFPLLVLFVRKSQKFFTKDNVLPVILDFVLACLLYFIVISII